MLHLLKIDLKKLTNYRTFWVVCVAAALRRGIQAEVLARGFRIAGLGQLVDSGIKADRLVVFGD